MRTDFPYELYTTPLAVRLAVKYTNEEIQIGNNVYLYFEHTVMDYWVLTATPELIEAIKFNLSLPYWEGMRETSYWFDMVAHNQVLSTGMPYETVRKWYPKGADLTNAVLLSD